MRILWPYGPPGVGKSTKAWEALNILANAGEATAFVDIDQLGMVYPAPSDDPYAERVAARALGAVAPEYERVGAETLVVSGVLNPALMPFYRDVLSSFVVAFVRLAVDETELHRRMDTRGADAEEWDSVLEEARAYEDAGLGHPVVIAQGATPTEVARSAIAAAITDPSEQATRDPREDLNPALPDHDAGEAILLGGTRAVGKSTIAWEAFITMRRDGTTTAFLDLRQLGFFGRAGGPVDHRLQTATLKAIWPVLRAAGAQLRLLNGSVDEPEQIEEYRASLGATPLTPYRLTADENALAERVRARGHGDGGARLAGDTLTGLSQAEARAVVAQALLAQEPADAKSTDPVLDTSDLTVQGRRTGSWGGAGDARPPPGRCSAGTSALDATVSGIPGAKDQIAHLHSARRGSAGLARPSDATSRNALHDPRPMPSRGGPDVLVPRGPDRERPR